MNGNARARRLSLQYDVPLLTLIRDSTYISRSQIRCLGAAVGVSSLRQGIDSRLRRLATWDLILVETQQSTYAGNVFSITHGGLLALESVGAFLPSVTSRSEVIARPNQILHFLELAQLRVTISEMYPVYEWMTDRDLSAANLVIPNPTAKNYDAIVTYTADKLPGGFGRFAVEYERTMKDNDRYETIRSRLASESALSCVLYFVDGPTAAMRLVEKVYAANLFVGVVDRFQFPRARLETIVRYKTAEGIKEAPFDLFLTATSKVPGSGTMLPQ